MAIPCNPYKIPDPVGHWEFQDGGYQPVAQVPSRWERLRNKVLYGWNWIPYDKTPAAQEKK